MTFDKIVRRTHALLLAAALGALAPLQAVAALADLSDVPLAQAPTSSVLPNLMYILDDSGSMNYNYMPDQVQTTSGGQTYRNCKICGAPNTVEGTGSASFTVTGASTSSDRITSNAAHGGTVGSTVVFTSPTPPGPFAVGTVYYISSVPSTTTFTLSATSGGSLIQLANQTLNARFVVNREQITTNNNHGGAVGSPVVFTSGTPPTPFALNVTYYIVRVVDNDSFILAATPGGAPILPTSQGVGATLDVNGGACGGPSGASAGSGVPCGNDETNANTPSTTSSPDYGEAPFYATVFNRIWYNPDITYSPAVDSTGNPLTNNTPTNASFDKFLGGATKNLVSNFEEVVYCNTTAPTAADLANPARCRFQGRHNVAPFLSGQPTYFLYWRSTGLNEGLPNSTFFHKVRITNSNPHYYNITPNEYCSDVTLVNCALATPAGASPGAPNTIAAPIRWCKTSADAASALVVTGSTGAPATPRCRKKFDRASGYVFPRYGRMARVDITSATGTFPRGPNSVRTDCAGPSCTYAEELQNFANWFGYYRVRMALMKTSTGRAFLSIDDRYRVGFITINPNSPVTTSKFVPVGQFDAPQRLAWYTKLYQQGTNGSTPLREALSRVGRYFAGVTAGINTGMGADPIQYSCQTNYALLTTDGYWNSNAGQNLSGAGIGNQDNTDSGFTTRGVGAYDGNLSGATDTLGDVAAYYYKTDLRTAGVNAPNNVPTSQKDTAAHQHMVTFGLGLGLEGLMDYVPDYETNNNSDFARIKRAEAGTCSWTAGTCNWPVPAQNDPSTLDDLWHAAVSGRGAYFSASDPNSLAQGLQSALAKLKVQTAAAAASATSSPNITQTDNFIYSSTFRTGVWDGEIVAQRIDVATGNILPAIVWSAQALLDARTSANADTRTVYTFSAGGNGRKDFTYATLTNTVAGAILPEQSYFANKCGTMGQCVLLTAAQQANANSGTNLVNYLRGQREFEAFTTPETTSPFRTREHILGDTVNATPVYVRRPSAGYTDGVSPTYEDFRIAQDTRVGVLYVASNDGMLHALNGETGQELWAYIPRIVMPQLHKLANANWGATHRFTVDGSPTTADVFVGGGWKTILVAGLNGGGRGYYAMDVTEPNNPKVLWEICADPTLCTLTDPDMGFSFGNAEIGKRASDGKWVVYVTSGLNNVSPGNGKPYLYVIDIATGAILNKVLANNNCESPSCTLSPAGLNRISAFTDNPFVDNTIKMIYGGDLYGNVYKFDTTVLIPAVTVLAQLKDTNGKPQSITTRPELATIDNFPVVYVGTGRYLGADDLVDPATLVPAQPFAYTNSLYGIKDKGTAYGNFRSANVVVNTLSDLGTTRTSSNNTVNWAIQDGWYVDLNPGNTSPGERVNLDPQLVLGTLVVVGNVPNNSVCTVGGDAFVYFFDYRSGSNVVTSTGGITGYKITGQTVVGFVIFSRGGGTGSQGGGPGGGGGGSGGGLECYYTGATGEKLRYQCPLAGSGGKARRTSWRELIERSER